MDIFIEGSANFSQIREQLALLQKQTAGLNAELARTGVASHGVNPQGYRQMQQAMRASSSAFKDAAASSGSFLTQQVRVNSATEEMTKRLNKQKVSIGEMWRERTRLNEVYKEQARLQSMYVRQSPSALSGGKGSVDLAVPRQVSKELDTINAKMAFAKTLTQSASTQMVNWGKNTQWAGRQLMVGFTIPMAAFGAAAGVMAYQVDKEMTRIMKVYDTASTAIAGDNASMMRVEKELAAVRVASWNTAKDASSQYGASAKDTLALQAQLASSGLNGVALQTSTSESMRIATLGELDYQSAVNTTISLQTAFKLSTSELTDAFNFMNATENATSLTIQDIAEAVPRAASAMSALGVSVEQMTVLMVSMKEAGVDAAEGANALKSATGTILAPSPAADAFIKQISNGKVQVTELAEASKGNLYVALQMLSEQMQGLDEVGKQQILVKLFGKYQFNRVSAMIGNLGDAFNGVGNQTKTAMDIMGKSAADNAKTAAAEIKRFEESLSGRFKTTLEEVKNEMTEMGAPFLEIGVFALNMISKVAAGFNSLPGKVKGFLAIGALLAAAFGPAVMLAGLFVNFLGTMSKLAGAFLFFGKSSKLVTKESKAMEIASRVAARGWDTQTTAVQNLVKELQILTNAEIAAAKAAKASLSNAPALSPNISRFEEIKQEYLANKQMQDTGPVPIHSVTDNKTAIIAQLKQQYLMEHQAEADKIAYDKAEAQRAVTLAESEKANHLATLEHFKQEYLEQQRIADAKIISDKEEILRARRAHAEILAMYKEQAMAAQRTSNGQYFGVNPSGKKSFITAAQADKNATGAAAGQAAIHAETVALQQQRVAQEALAADIMRTIGYKEVSGKVGIDVSTQEKALIQQEAMAYDKVTGAVDRVNQAKQRGVVLAEAELYAAQQLAAARAKAVPVSNAITPEQQLLADADHAANQEYSAMMAKEAADNAEAEAFAKAKVAEEQTVIVAESEKEAVARNKTRRFLVGSAASAGIMASSILAMSISSNETVQYWSGIALLGATIVPMFIQAGNAVKALLANMAATRAATAAAAVEANILAAAQTRAAIASTAAAGAGKVGMASAAASTAATVGRFGKLGAVVGTVGSRIALLAKGITSFLGPIGLAVSALTIVGGILYKQHKDAEDALKKQRELIDAQKAAADSMTKSTEAWATNTGRTLTALKQIKTASLMPINQGTYSQQVDYYKNSEDASTRTYMDSFAASPGGDTSNGVVENSQQYQLAMQKFWELQVRGGLSAKEAAQEIRAMFEAAGEGAFYADQAAISLLNNIGDVDKASMGVQQQILTGLVDSARPSLIQFGTDLDTNGAIEVMKTKAQDVAAAFVNQFAEATGPEAFVLQETLKNSVDTEWLSAYMNLEDNKKSLLEEMGITGADAYKEFINSYQQAVAAGKAGGNPYAPENGGGAYQMAEDLRANNPGLFMGENGVPLSMEQVFGKGAEGAQALEKEMVKLIAASSGLKGEYKDLDTLFNDILYTSKTQPVTSSMVDAYKEQINAFKNVVSESMGGPSNEEVLKERKRLLYDISQILVANGVDTSKIQNLNQAIVLLQKLQNGELDNMGGKIKSQIGDVRTLGYALGQAYKFSGEDYKNILQSGIQSMQEQMANQASTNFDNRMQADIEANQSRLDAAIESQQNAQQRASDALDKRQENESQKFDDRWELRKTRVGEYWDARIDKVNESIKAEQKAEDTRQKIFDAEMTRLDRLNDAANRNIDFNVALNSGNLDEAAKIRNDAEAQFADYALQDAAAASGTGSSNKIDRLGNRADNLGNRKDEAQNALDDLEEAQRKSLDRQQEMERKHLEKTQEMRAKALQEQADAEMDRRTEAWELDKISNDDRLELFRSWNGRSMEEILAWADQVGIEYEDFGDKRLKPMGESWAKFFKDQLVDKIAKAANETANNKMWEDMATKEAEAIIKGFGFPDFKSLKIFARTGVMPKKPQPGDPGFIGPVAQPNHGGGRIGDGGSGRAGVARTQRGTGPGERMVLARDNEFMVNEKSYAANKDLVHDINNSKGPMNPTLPKGVMGGVGVGLGSAGLIGAIGYNMFLAGMKGVISNAVDIGKQKQANLAATTSFSAGDAGVYGDVSFSPEQMNNAKTIADAGKSMGMSDRDIEIGIMTAITESGLKNLDFGDRDSLGLFQQRASWGSTDQRTDPTWASKKFFSELDKISNRDARLPWFLAQDVQRSAYDGDPYPYGSNYQGYWDEAQQIFKNGLTSNVGAYTAGPGGSHRPVNIGTSGGLHDTETSFPGIDFSIPTGTPIYSVGNGIITRSEDISGPLSTDRYKGDGPYGSYGRVIQLRLDNGPEVLYAHLSSRGVAKNQKVSGGSIIGKSGNTGNSSGDHLHFGSSDGNPMQFLKTGGTTIGQGLAYLHDQETVLTKPLSKDLHSVITALADTVRKGGKKNKGNKYSVNTFTNGMGDANSTAAQIMAASYLNNNVGSMFDNSWFSSGNKKKKTLSDPNSGNGTVRSGTYNLGRGSNDKSKKDLIKLMQKADILGLNEMSSRKKSLIPWMNSQGWGFQGGEHPGAALLWNKDVLNMKDHGTKALSGKGSSYHREAVYGKFSGAGSDFWQIAAHAIAWPYRTAARRNTQTEQFKNLRELWGNLHKNGTPVILGGDMNDSIARGDWIKNIGLGEGTNSGTATHGKSWLDHLFSVGMTAGEQKVVKGLSSDHNAVLNEFSLPGFKTGGFMTSEGLAYLHDDEAVTSKPLTDNLIRGAENFANGGSDTYNLTVNANGTSMDAQELAKITIQELKRIKDRQPRSRKP